MNTKAIEEQDKYRAAIHEAAHLTATMALGGRARAFIWRAEEPVNAEEYSWRGQCQFMESPRGVNRRAVVGISGLVGESLHEEADVDGRSIEEWMEIEIIEPSPTDWDCIKTSRLLVATLADRALHLLRTHKSFWEWAITQLNEVEVITDGQAAEHFAAHTDSLSRAHPNRS
jgi:urease accessory protein UreH